MNRDLFLAILAMDSYNRDYGAGVKITGSSVGSADQVSRISLGLDDSIYQNWQSAGFYAVAYDWVHDGITERVVAYRGTDGNKITDIINGWFVGGGFYVQPQARLAIEFYKAVVGADADGYFTANPFTSNITLTGHSLGGGLAGYVASLYARPATIFDNMPFELASYLANQHAQLNESTGWGSMKQFLYGQYSVPEVDRSGIDAWATDNEILQILRENNRVFGLLNQGTPVDKYSSYAGPEFDSLGNRAGKLHMQDLLVNLMNYRNGLRVPQFAQPKFLSYSP